MRKLSFLFVALLFLSGLSMKPKLPEEDFCGLRNNTTKAGEQITFHVFYNVAGLYVMAGTASFTNNIEKLNGRPVFHITGEGRTNDSYDWIFKVRDKYETYIDTATMQPLKFIRNVQEGGHKNYENISFNHSTNTAVTTKGVFKVPDCVQDVLSSIYYARNIDFNKYKPNDKIPFTMFLDNEVYNMYVRYLGKEEIKTRYGRFKTIKFKPLLVKGTIFEGGEKMTVWVSDDANKIPVRIESPIVIGNVKVDMMNYKNLRHPLTGLKKANGL
jgi:hypothetical protein